MGFDQPKSLGTNEFGSGLALSTWLDYMQPVLKGVPDAKQAPRPDGLLVENGEYYFSEFPPGQAVASLDLSSGDALTDFLNNNRSTDGVDTSVKPLPPPGAALAPSNPTSAVQAPLMPIPAPRADNAPATGSPVGGAPAARSPAAGSPASNLDSNGVSASAVTTSAPVMARPL
ncbi:hypothetical protein G6F59_016828 [Rhizopus arrhizus]|nr:hypothetical protein G6F59_016828 [Rhizopus arrhizus]